MATVKSYTDISQSKKLAEILPIESADGFWEYHDKWCSEGDEWEGYEDYPRAEPYLEYTRKENEWKEDKSDIPCWSLAALLEILNYPQLSKDKLGNGKKGWMVSVYPNNCRYDSCWHDNPVDACYEMVIRLNELNLL